MWVAALRRADPPYKESYRLCMGLRSWKAAKAEQKAVEPLELDDSGYLQHCKDVLASESEPRH
jgi:hypothetical protein